MALPELLAPPGTCFLFNGHANTPDSFDDDFDVMQGHARKRRVQTAIPRVVDVSCVFKTADAADVFDDWYENTLVVGNGLFTAKIAPIGADTKYYAAQWVAPPLWTPLDHGKWQLSGQLLLTGAGSDILPLGATLRTEYRIDLTGSATVTSGVLLATEYVIHLLAYTPLRTEYLVELLAAEPAPPSDELREDGGLELREDGGTELRE